MREKTNAAIGVAALGCELQAELRGLSGGQFLRVVPCLGWRADDLHLLPVVGQFPAAIQADHIHSG